MPAKNGMGCLPMLGWLIFLIATVNVASNYGHKWEFGKYGAPVTLLAPDGVHHPDGTPVEPITLALAQSGAEQIIFVVLFLYGVVCLTYAYSLTRKTERIRQQMLETCRMEAELYQRAREGRGNSQS